MREDATSEIEIEITILTTACAGLNRHPRARIDATEITTATTAAAQARKALSCAEGSAL
jgi:hypothetical protein